MPRAADTERSHEELPERFHHEEPSAAKPQPKTKVNQKSIFNHEEHEGHEGKRNNHGDSFFFVLFVAFVVKKSFIKNNKMTGSSTKDTKKGIHEAQLLTYMKLAGVKSGLLINSNSGIRH